MRNLMILAGTALLLASCAGQQKQAETLPTFQNTGNPLVTDKFTADPAPMVHDGTLSSLMLLVVPGACTTSASTGNEVYQCLFISCSRPLWSAQPDSSSRRDCRSTRPHKRSADQWLPCARRG